MQRRCNSLVEHRKNKIVASIGSHLPRSLRTSWAARDAYNREFWQCKETRVDTDVIADGFDVELRQFSSKDLSNVRQAVERPQIIGRKTGTRKIVCCCAHA